MARSRNSSHYVSRRCDRKRQARRPVPLEQPEIHFDVSGDDDSFAVLQARLEAPLVDRLDRLFVESEADSFNHSQIPRVPVLVYFDIKHDSARVLGLAGFLGVFRIYFEEHSGRRHSTAHAVDAATDAAAFAGSEARAFTGSYATAGARSDAAARSRSIRRGSNLGQRIAPDRHIVIRELDVRR